jgi:hypothetical protein
MSESRFAVTLSGTLAAEFLEAKRSSGASEETLIRKAMVLLLAAKAAECYQGLKVGFYNPNTHEIETEVVNL